MCSPQSDLIHILCVLSRPQIQICSANLSWMEAFRAHKVPVFAKHFLFIFFPLLFIQVKFPPLSEPATCNEALRMPRGELGEVV